MTAGTTKMTTTTTTTGIDMTMRLPLLLTFAAALSSSPLRAETQYSISAPGTVLAGYVIGPSLAVSVVAPDGKHSERVTLRLNGADVTSALHADASGALSGTVDGLQPGANSFELFAKKESVASLTVMRALAPAVSCASLASLAGFPVQGGFDGKVVTQATLTAASSTLPEYCLVRGILLKGAGWADLWPHVWPMLIFMFVVMALAVRFYRRTLD